MTRPLWLAAALAGGGLVPAIVAAVLFWPLFAHAWLAATLTWGLLPIGAMAILLTMGLTGGGWGELSRPAARALMACLPVAALALLPLLLFARDALFPWTQPVETLPEVVRNKLLYLNEPFFIARTLGYFTIWLVLAWFVGAWHGARRAGGVLCAGGLVLLLHTVSFFAYDWFLSLEPKFYTDVFGLWLAVTIVLGAGAVVLLALYGAADRVSVSRRADFANLWLALLLGWAFLAFSQYIIIWITNIPHEIVWYLNRGSGVWRAMSWLIFFLIFAIPFLVLLVRSAKESGRALTWMAGVALLGYVLQVQWWILPAAKHASAHLFWIAPACLAALGGIFAGAWLWLMRRQEVEHERA